MRIQILRKMGYCGTYIYIFQRGITFEYLFSWDMEIYRQEVIFKPRLWRSILTWFGWIPAYSKQQLEEIEGVVLSGAMSSIDLLRQSGAKKKMKEVRRKARRGECMWQTRTDDKDKGFYECIVHHLTAPLEEGKAPKHK